MGCLKSSAYVCAFLLKVYDIYTVLIFLNVSCPSFAQYNKSIQQYAASNINFTCFGCHIPICLDIAMVKLAFPHHPTGKILCDFLYIDQHVHITYV